jgi:lipopolysaccharide biosynthesis glycosyltransferase
MSIFNESYPMKYDKDNWPVKVDWGSVFKHMCHLIIPNSVSNTLLEIKPSQFGTFSYDLRRQYLKAQHNSGMNIGDEIQGLAGIQFLPHVNRFVERDKMSVSYARRIRDHVMDETMMNTTVFANAWYGNSATVWPPPPSIDAMLLSIHVEHDGNFQKKLFEKKDSISYLQERGPIGARDSDTLSVLQRHDVLSFFSGCMTMTFSIGGNRTSDIIIVDVPDDIASKYIPPQIVKRSKFLSHKLVSTSADDSISRYESAFNHLREYAKAKMVITSRLHAALPSVALGTPVVFVNGDKLPGGEGEVGQSRVESLITFTNIVNESNYEDFVWSLETNRELDRFSKMRQRLQHVVTCRDSRLSDAAMTFGMLPATIPLFNSIPCVDKEKGEDKESLSSAISVAFCIDKNLFLANQGSALASFVRSLAMSNKNVSFVFYVLADNLSYFQHCLISRILHMHMKVLRVYVLDLSRLLQASTANHENSHHTLPHISRVTMARLYLPDILSCVDKLLWLDIDTLVLASLQELWETDLSDITCGIAARKSVSDGFTKNFIKKDRQLLKQFGVNISSISAVGFNAGVMLMSLQKLRNSYTLKDIFNFRSIRDILTKIGENDQTILNFYCNGKFYELNPSWNVFLFSGKITDPLHEMKISEWKIFHWTGSMKIWNIHSADQLTTKNSTGLTRDLAMKLNHLVTTFKTYFENILL